MANSPPSNDQIHLTEAAAHETGIASYDGFHALLPTVIGFAIPLVLFMLAAPSVTQDIRFVVLILLALVALITAAIFILSLLRPGTTLEAHFDGRRRMVRIIRSGLFAHTVYTVPFNRICAVRIETSYDDDGYATLQPLLILRPREVIDLPPSTTAHDIANIRAMLGLAPSATGTD